ncbi:MAG: CHAT domain-containing protein [Bacteroidota bacterium]
MNAPFTRKGLMGLLLIVLTALLPVCAQETLFAEASQARDNEKYELAIEKFDQAAEYFFAQKNAERWQSCHEEMARSTRKLGRKDAYLYLEKCLENAWWPENLQTAKLYLFYGTYLSDDLQRYEAAIKAFEHARQLFEPGDFTKWPYFIRNEAYFGSKAQFLAFYIYDGLGRSYSRIGEAQRSSFFLAKAEKIYQDEREPEKLAITYQNWSGSLWDGKDFWGALEKSAMGLALADSIDFYTHAGLLINHSLYLVEIAALTPESKDSLQKLALTKIHQAIDLLETEEVVDYYLYQAYSVKGDILFSSSETDAALYAYQYALNLAREVNDDHRQVAKIDLSLTRLYLNQGKYDAALQKIQDAISRILPQKTLHDLHQLPDATELYLENVFLEALELKMEIYLAQYQTGGKPINLHRGIDCMDLILVLERLFVESYQYESAQLQMIAESHRRHELGLAMLDELEKINPGPANHVRMLHLMESNRAIIFTQESNRPDVWQAMGLSTDMYTRLRREMNQLRREIVFEEDAEQSLLLKNRLNDLLEQKDSLIQAVNVVLPQTIDTWPQKIDLTDLQERLNEDNSSLLQFFMGEAAIYALWMDAEQSRYMSIPRTDTFEQWLDRSIGYQQTANAAFSPEYFAAFVTDAQWGFDHLIKALVPDELPAQLILIPDGQLGLLSFDSFLLREIDASGPVDYTDLPYWFHATAIRYNYSTNQYLRQRDRSSLSDAEPYLGIAPAYDFSESQLLPLSEGGTLIELVAERLGGDVFSGEKATAKDFAQKIQQDAHQVLHFHGHADTSQHSWLAFSDEKMYLFDLYGLDMRAELGILSACQSGVGRIEKGEGIFNLGRAMQLAGCRNVLLRIWEADERETARLMEKYLTLLAEGKGKADALRETKMWYLTQNGPGRHHPYYWSNFYLVGDNEPISFTKPISQWQLAFLLLLLLTGLVLGWRWWENYQRGQG